MVNKKIDLKVSVPRLEELRSRDKETARIDSNLTG